ncbi:uncharacterized protein LOC108100199 isoform X1 [Drosophila ficusphila]|uniref:uncharacterized protein LOC108100199 isoform X1 n=1 Tax=Drosophila ficusphila TaxID=30025 RepID=UPI001C8AB04F|nr:uncharacterized protein LOC108100199 isoform X1 [Drosophila ficusphila]
MENQNDRIYSRNEIRDRQRRNANEKSSDESTDSSSEPQTSKKVNYSYKKYYKNIKRPSKRNINFEPYLEHRKSRNYRESSPEGDAPIYTLNAPEEPNDPEPKCNPAGHGKKSSSECQDNKLLYMIAGYVVGILMVLIWYYRNPQKARRDLNGRWIFIVLFFLLLIILVQKRPARCIAALCFFSLVRYQFRALIIAFAFLVACCGPVKTTIHNICIMANSLYCGQNVLIQALSPMQRIINDPSHSVEESFQGTLAAVRKLVNKLDKLLLNLEKPIALIHVTYRTCGDWLILQKNHFDYRMGSPYNRCMKAGNLSVAQCQSEFYKETKECCNLQRFAWFCESLRGIKSFFDDNIQWSLLIIEEIFKRLHICFIKIRYVFISTISFDHKLKLNSTSSLTAYTDQKYEQDFTQHLDSERNKLFFIFLWLDLIVFVLLLTCLLQSVYFWFRFLGNGSYENVFITKDFENLDERHYQENGSRALPLSSCEENQYVMINSLRLLPKEYSKRYHSGMFLVITGIQLFCICFVDYSLYSMLTFMSYHGHMTAGLQPPAYKQVIIKGGGQIGDLLREFVHAFEPKAFKTNTQKCLPIPAKPKYLRYLWIFLLYLLAWFLVFWEPYGLRQRHRIMGHFYPKESRRRVYELHDTILKDRKTLFQTRIKQARLLNAFEDNKFKLPWFNSNKIWRLYWGRNSLIGRSCTVCNKPLNKTDHYPCDLPNCRGNLL